MDGSDHQEATCQCLKYVNFLGEHLADSQFCEAWKKEKYIIKIKYSQNISEARKIVKTTYPTWSYSRVTQPMPTTYTSGCQKCNLLIRKLANMNLNEFLTFIKELQTSTQQSKQISLHCQIHLSWLYLPSLFQTIWTLSPSPP